MYQKAIDFIYVLMEKVGIYRGKDQALHLAVGFTVSLVVGLVYNPALGFATGTSLGILKESYDKWIKKTEWHYFDFFFTMVGAVSATMLLGLFGL